MFIFTVLSNVCCSGRSRKKPENFAAVAKFRNTKKIFTTARNFCTVAKFRNRPVAGCTKEPTEKDKTRNSKVQVKIYIYIYIYINFY